jgi:hypothetical protein
MFSQMVTELKKYEGKSIMTPLPSQSEWAKENMSSIQKGTYQPSKYKPKTFYTVKRHYTSKNKSLESTSYRWA